MKGLMSQDWIFQEIEKKRLDKWCRLLESLLTKSQNLVVKPKTAKVSNLKEIVSEGEMKPVELLTKQSYKMPPINGSLSS